MTEADQDVCETEQELEENCQLEEEDEYEDEYEDHIDTVILELPELVRTFVDSIKYKVANDDNGIDEQITRLKRICLLVKNMKND